MSKKNKTTTAEFYSVLLHTVICCTEIYFKMCLVLPSKRMHPNQMHRLRIRPTSTANNNRDTAL